MYNKKLQQSLLHVYEMADKQTKTQYKVQA